MVRAELRVAEKGLRQVKKKKALEDIVLQGEPKVINLICIWL